MESTDLDTTLNLNINAFCHRKIVSFISPMEVSERIPQTEVFQGDASSEFIHTDTLEKGKLQQIINRILSENERLTATVESLSRRCRTLQNHLNELHNRHSDVETTPPRKRKHDSDDTCYFNDCVVGPSSCSCCCSSDEESTKRRPDSSKPKVSTIHVRTDVSDTSLVVKDGYQWRKYGQKLVTRDNPSPRAYFRCSFAPSCTVKKKVQRSVEDSTVLVATYEGEHNHGQSSLTKTPSSPSNLGPKGANLIQVSTHARSSSGVTLDLVQQKPNNEPSLMKILNTEEKTPLPPFWVEQMASSLTNDPEFRAALAAAMSGRMLDIK